MRRGEALGLRWKDLDLSPVAGRATIARTASKVGGKVLVGTPKSGKARSVTLDPFTVAVLSQHRTRQAAERLRLGTRWVDQDLVFAHDGNKLGPEGRAGGFLNSDHVWRLLQAAVSKYNADSSAGLRLPAIPVHSLRHSWATMAMLKGVHPMVVKERLGHSTVSITLEMYSHVSSSMQEDAALNVASGFLS